MTGKAHAGIGTAAGIAVCSRIPGGFSLIGITVLIIASLLPDIDHPKSILNQYILPIKNKTVKVFLYGSFGVLLICFNMVHSNKVELNVMGAVLIVVAFSSHRKGFTHSIVGMMIFAFIANYIAIKYNNEALVYYFIIGYGTHIFCDMLTNRGVPLFYPLKNKNVKFPFTFRVGSSMGKAVEDMIIIISILYMLYRLPMILHLK